MKINKILEIFDNITKNYNYYSNQNLRNRIENMLMELIDLVRSDDPGFVKLKSERIIRIIEDTCIEVFKSKEVFDNDEEASFANVLCGLVKEFTKAYSDSLIEKIALRQVLDYVIEGTARLLLNS